MNDIRVKLRMESGGSGTADYNKLLNRPKINGVTLEGELTTEDLGIQIPTEVSELENDADYQTASDVQAAMAQKADASALEELQTATVRSIMGLEASKADTASLLALAQRVTALEDMDTIQLGVTDTDTGTEATLLAKKITPTIQPIVILPGISSYLQGKTYRATQKSANVLEIRVQGVSTEVRGPVKVDIDGWDAGGTCVTTSVGGEAGYATVYTITM